MSAQQDVASVAVSRTPVPWLAIWLAALVLAFQDVFQYFLYMWGESNTFAHGYFVVPLAIAFAWMQRRQFIGISPHTSRLAGFLVLLAVIAEYLGYLFSISIVQQLAVTGAMIAGVVTFVGWQVAARMWFPLSLLLFVPPVGNELIPLFQSITADLSVWMLGFSAIPIYRDGLYIIIPNQVFEVAEACSGIRFFISCLFLGYIYAAINFVSIPKRILFLAFAIVLPIVANGLRVFGIIMLGHYVDMKYAKGFDHLFVGWVFFFIVTGVLILVGIMFADKKPAVTAVEPDAGWWQASWRTPFLWVMLPLALSVAAKMALSPEQPGGEIQVSAVATSGPELPVVRNDGAAWSPSLTNPDGSYRYTVVVNRRMLDAFIGWYNDDKPGTKLITGANRLYDGSRWSIVGSQRQPLTLHGVTFDAAILTLASPGGQRRFVLYWYDVPGLRSADRIRIKLYQGLNKVRRDFRGGKLIALSGPLNEREVLSDLIQQLQQQGVVEQLDMATELRM